MMPHALLVDDHSETLDALTELAEEQGFTVSTAERSTAPQRARTPEPDVIVADLNLPDGSGLALPRRARRDRRPRRRSYYRSRECGTAIEALQARRHRLPGEAGRHQRLREILGDIRKTSVLARRFANSSCSRPHRALRRRLSARLKRCSARQSSSRASRRAAPASSSQAKAAPGKDVVAKTIHDLSRSGSVHTSR